VSDLQLLLSQLGKRTDAPPLQPTDQLRKDPEAVTDRADRVALTLISKPLDKTIHLRAEDR
jgi:hypothetical protein